MYDMTETVIAVSSPTHDNHVIVRLTGPGTFDILNQITKQKPARKQATTKVEICVDPELFLDARLYLFVSPYSYTGDDLAEIHFNSNRALTEALILKLLELNVKMAGPGEFTARAYLNGKIDLAQAEAVNEIIISSNRFQLSAAEKLLGGRLANEVGSISQEILESISLLEAGIDFSTEDIEFLTAEEAVEKLTNINKSLENIVENSIDCELLMELPSVGIAGAPNSGKSSLLNTLLGKPRSIVSGIAKTTRDILSGHMTLDNSQCVLFDCAGLLEKPEIIIDQLAQQAAIESLSNSSLVIFCVDISKENLSQDIHIRKLFNNCNVINLATKIDLVRSASLPIHIKRLNDTFSSDFFGVSALKNRNITGLKQNIDSKLLQHLIGPKDVETKYGLLLNARHKGAVAEAIENINQAISEIKDQNDEVAAMLLRSAYEAIGTMEQQDIEDKVLEKIFSNFCIGK